MKLQTPVIDTPNKVNISYKDKILMLGSCFADNIGTRLKNYGFDAMVNPFGTLYNPHSILNCLRKMAANEQFTKYDCIEMGAGAGKICSFSHHTSFAKKTETEFLDNANSKLAEAAEFLKQCNKIIITLGTSWCYRHIDSDIIVSNCLKRPGYEFSREKLSIADVEKCLKESIDIVRQCTDENTQADTNKEFIFTVSPIRHLADGAHGNQISKATLILGIEALSETAGTDYFPSYEIMMDELRDYRFYAEDMCHPTKQAEEYIFERFIGWALPKTEIKTFQTKIKQYKREQHITML